MPLNAHLVTGAEVQDTRCSHMLEIADRIGDYVNRKVAPPFLQQMERFKAPHLNSDKCC